MRQFYETAVRLTLQSQTKDDVVVIQCRGRIVAGAEVEALEAELEKRTKIPGTDLRTANMVVLHLADVDYIDSSGLGALVRVAGALRNAGGSLNLCQVSPFVFKVLQVTNLLSILPTHASESEAVEACYKRLSRQPVERSRTTIVCVDTSRDLLAYLRALLTSSGYEVHTASNLADAKSLVSALNPQVVICGAGILGLPTGEAVVEGFRQRPDSRILRLPPEFSTADAGQAGVDLVSQIQSLITN